jgi:hypothetical protein
MSVSGKALELSLSSLIRTWALVSCCKSAIFLWYTNVWLVSICPSQSRAEIDLILHWRQRRFPTTPGRLLLCSIPSNGQLQVRDRYKAGRPVIPTTFSEPIPVLFRADCWWSDRPKHCLTETADGVTAFYDSKFGKTCCKSSWLLFRADEATRSVTDVQTKPHATKFSI